MKVWICLKWKSWNDFLIYKWWYKTGMEYGVEYFSATMWCIWFMVVVFLCFSFFLCLLFLCLGEDRLFLSHKPWTDSILYHCGTIVSELRHYGKASLKWTIFLKNDENENDALCSQDKPWLVKRFLFLAMFGGICSMFCQVSKLRNHISIAKKMNANWKEQTDWPHCALYNHWIHFSVATQQPSTLQPHHRS